MSYRRAWPCPLPPHPPLTYPTYFGPGTSCLKPQNTKVGTEGLVRYACKAEQNMFDGGHSAIVVGVEHYLVATHTSSFQLWNTFV